MIGGIVSGITGLIGNILQKQSNEETNWYNYQMHLEQQKQNYQMFLEANDFTKSEREAAQGYNTLERLASQQYNTDMWNKSNEYNSPAAQAARLRAVGLNPALLINGAGTTSPVQSSPSSSSGGSSVTPPYGQAFQKINPLDTSAFGTGFLTMSQAIKTLKEAKGIEIDNESRDAKNRATIDNLIVEKEQMLENKNLTKAERHKLHYEITGLKIQNMRQRFQARKDLLVEDREREIHENVIRQFELTHRKAELDYATQQLMNRLAVNKDSRDAVLLNKQLQFMSSEIDKMASEKGYIDVQALTEVTKRNGISLDNLSKAFQVEDQKLDYERSKWLKKAREQDKGVRVIDNLAYYFGKAIGVPVKGIFK